jgi:hypothetical protein
MGCSSHAEAIRSMAVAAFTVEQTGLNTYPNPV